MLLVLYDATYVTIGKNTTIAVTVFSISPLFKGVPYVMWNNEKDFWLLGKEHIQIGNLLSFSISLFGHIPGYAQHM